MVEQVISFPVPPESRKDVLFTEITNRLLAYIREDWLDVDEATLAKRLGVPSDTVIEVELGLVPATIAYVFKFSEATGIPAARIIGAVQIVERWMQANTKSLEPCFTLPDARHAFLKLHRLIDVGIREMPMPLRVTFDAPVKPAAPAAQAPVKPAPQVAAPTPPAPVEQPPMKLTPVAEVIEEEPDIVDDDEDFEEDDDDGATPTRKMAPFEPELVEIRPLAHLFDTPKRVAPAPAVVVSEGVRKRGRPRKNPL